MSEITSGTAASIIISTIINVIIIISSSSSIITTIINTLIHNVLNTQGKEETVSIEASICQFLAVKSKPAAECSSSNIALLLFSGHRRERLRLAR